MDLTLQISERVSALARQAEQGLGEQFARIDAIAQANTQRVLAAFQKHRVAENYFAGTTGYGYDDLGRDKLDEIYADLFGTEDALVRIQFVNGTHAISCALFGALKAGDVLLSAVGAPYDTLLGVVGAGGAGPPGKGRADPAFQRIRHPGVPVSGRDWESLRYCAGKQSKRRHFGG